MSYSCSFRKINYAFFLSEGEKKRKKALQIKDIYRFVVFVLSRFFLLGVMVHAYNLSTWEQKAEWITRRSRLAWIIYCLRST